MKQFWLKLLKHIYLTTFLAILIVLGSKLPVNGRTKPGFLLVQNIPENFPDDTDINPLPPFRPIEPTPQSPQLETLPSLENLLEEAAPPLPSGQPGELTSTFIVRKFQVEGSTVFTNEEIQAVVRDYIDRPINWTDLLEVEARLTKLYTDNGYINSGAVIPPQKIKDGVVKVTIFEGMVDDILVTVNGRLNKDYIRSRLEKATRKPFNIKKLQEALRLLQLDPLIENLTAELKVGVSRDRRLLEIEINQANAFEPVIFANNSRTPSVGSFQRGVEINHNNLLGFGDRFSTIYKNTDGSNDIETGYTIPFNASNGTVGFRYRYVDSNIVEEPFDDIDIESETDQYQFILRQPIILTANDRYTQEVALGLEFSRQSNKITIGDDPSDFSPGSDDNGETRISVLRFFQDWTKRTRQSVLAARSQFSVGVDLFDASIAENRPDGSFFGWRGQIQWLQRLDSESNINLLLRSDVQLSPNDLVPLEQFSIGGIDSVRGYRQDLRLGDQGIFTSAEVRIPLHRWSNNQNFFSFIPFVDFGTVWSNSDREQIDEDTLVSIGAGIQLTLNDHLRARLDYGIPLIEVESPEKRTAQENGVYFSLEYFPF